MAEDQAGLEQQELKSWYSGLLEKVTQDMLKIGAVTGSAVEARPVWASPHQILIARVWPVAQKSNFIWAIAGEAVVTDHIAGATAVTAQEAARHFSMKWQMDADRMLRAAGQETVAESSAAQMEAHAQKLIQCAEQLYDLTERADIWTNTVKA
jgi:hypothetical protein